MNQVGQVAEAGRPKWAVERYGATYRKHRIIASKQNDREWYGMAVDVQASFSPHHETAESAMTAAVAWVDAQEEGQ